MADNDQKLKDFKVELAVQVDERSAIRSLQKVIDTSEQLTKTSIRGNEANKEKLNALIKTVKKLGDLYGTTSNRYKNALLQTQEAMDAQLSGQKGALNLQMKKIKVVQSELNRTNDLVMAVDAIGTALKEQVRIQSELIEDEQEREKYLKSEVERIESNVALRKKEAVVLRGSRKELKRITEETAAIRENTLETAEATRGERTINKVSASANRGARGFLGAIDTMRGGYNRNQIESLVSQIKGVREKYGSNIKQAGARADARLAGLANSDSKMLRSASKLSGVFTKLSKAVSLATRFLGFFAAAVMIAIDADAERKETFKTLSKNLGSAGMREGDLSKLGSFVYEKAVETDTLRLSVDEVRETANALMTSGVNLKSLQDGFEGLKSIIDTTTIVGRNFGLEMSEASRIVGDYFQTFGAGSAKIKDVFAAMNENIKNSGMSTNQFLATMQSVSSQFNIFLDQTKEFSSVLEKISKGGALTGKQLEKLVGTLAGFGPKTVDEGIKAMALYGPQIKKRAAQEEKDVRARLEKNQYGTEAERYQDLRKLESLQVVKKGGINAGAALGDAVGSLGMLSAFLEKQGIKTFDQMRDARNNTEQIKLMSAMLGMSDEQVRDLLEATSAVMQDTNQTVSQALEKNAKDIQTAVGNAQAKREAESISENTVTALAGAQDVGNAILYRISELMQKVYNALVNIGKFLSPSKWFSTGISEDTKTSQIESEGLKRDIAAKNPTAKGASLFSGSEVNVTGVQSSNLNENMTKRLSQRNVTIGAKTVKRSAAAAQKTVAPNIKTPTAPATSESSTLPKVSDSVAPSSTGTSPAGTPQVNMSAVLQLANNQPIELIVKKVLYEREKRN